MLCATSTDGLDKLCASGLGLGAGVGVGAAGPVVGALAGVGLAVPADSVGGTIVGTRGADCTPVNTMTLPSTIEAATNAFKANDAYQRQSRFSRFGFDLLDMPLLQIIGRDYTISGHAVKYPGTLERLDDEMNLFYNPGT